jgi:hypothetical protein
VGRVGDGSGERDRTAVTAATYLKRTVTIGPETR